MTLNDKLEKEISVREKRLEKIKLAKEKIDTDYEKKLIRQENKKMT